jgi:hypothetical protein
MEWRKGFDFVSAFPGYVRQVGEKTGQRRGGSGVSSAIALDLPKRLYGVSLSIASRGKLSTPDQTHGASER